MSLSASVDEALKSAISEAVAGVEAHRAALSNERDRLDQRDRAITDAVRAGARLEEIAVAASITRAAASLAARRTLAARPGRGGPYSRRRSAALALTEVSEAAEHLLDARRRSAEAKLRRDAVITSAIDRGAGVRATARALGMAAGAISTIARDGRSSVSTDDVSGAVASRR